MDDEKIIAAVHSRRALYDKSHPKYRNREALSAIWKSCAKEVGTHDVETLKKRWCYLRDYFVRQNRSMPSSMSVQDAAKSSRWPLYAPMAFLLSHTQQREKFGNMTSTDHDFSWSSDCDKFDFDPSDLCLATADPVVQVKLEDDDDIGMLPDPALPNAERVGGKRPAPDPIPVDPRLLKVLKSSDDCDDDDHFFKSLKPLLSQLGLIEKLEFRNDVHKLLIDYIRRHPPDSHNT